MISISAVLFDFRLPDFNRLHLNWHALGVLLGKYCEISFQPIFLTSFKWRSSRSSCGSHEEGFLLEFFEGGSEGDDSWASSLDMEACGWRESE